MRTGERKNMKILILLSLLSFSAFASEFPSDPCPRLERQEREVRHEMNLLRIEAARLAEQGRYPQEYDELGCEDVMDDATFVDRRIKSLQKKLKKIRASRSRYCYRGDDIP